ncbi:hypothetical protein KIPB_012730, partial [Kipferlia bialata]|eukprot:g12730.t1
MGNTQSKDHKYRISTRYESYADLTRALRESGLESSQLMIGVDASKSNLWTGERTYPM